MKWCILFGVVAMVLIAPLGITSPLAAAGVDVTLAGMVLLVLGVAAGLKGRLDDLTAGIRRDNDLIRAEREVLRRRLDVLEHGDDGLAGLRKALVLLEGRVEGLRRRLDEAEELARHADLKGAAAVATAEKAVHVADDHARALAGRLEVRAGEAADLYERLRRVAAALTTSTIPCNRTSGAIQDGRTVRGAGAAGAAE